MRRDMREMPTSSSMEVIKLSGRAPEVSDFLREAMLSQRFADVALCCPGGQKFLAHRLVLSAASPYLQEVLLAHSKSTSYCEPITVILAEIEGPELAALLGFVYTGSATVPRSRLDAFLRAAEALHIRLPSIPNHHISSNNNNNNNSTSYERDLKDELKVPLPPQQSYLHAQQYPSSWNFVDNKHDWPRSSPEPLRIWNNEPLPMVYRAPIEEPIIATWTTNDKSEDLSCREKCCTWRLARRQVSNQVTASPWRQIVRPHHSPKIQPIMQSHPSSSEPMVEMGSQVDTYRGPVSPCTLTRCCLSPKSCEAQPLINKDTFYQVPTSDQPAVLTDYYGRSASVPTAFYPTALPTPPTNLTTSPIHVPIKPVVQVVQQPPPPPVLPASQQPLQQQQQQRSASKPEISHPVSRLCDSLENDTQKKQTDSKDTENDPKVLAAGRQRNYPLVSDDNNNEATSINEREATTTLPTNNNVNENDHKCDQCGKTFVTRASLKVHLRTHSGEKPFRCTDCGKQFSQLRNYKYHRSVHEGTREFAASCPECGKYFNDRGYLSSHMKIHRNRKEYACAECGKSFNQRVAYNMHVRIHTGLKPHQCEQCGKAFSRKMLLKQHLRTHSGERPYQCQVCHKAFADRSNMTLHTRLHSGLKPYQCTLCSKAFTKKHHLKTHLNYHTGTKPYSCPNCNLRFSQSSNMRTHYKKCAVNNPNGLAAPNNNNNVVATANAVNNNQQIVVGNSTSSALTPPNSDQESTILTPIVRPNVTSTATIKT